MQTNSLACLSCLINILARHLPKAVDLGSDGNDNDKVPWQEERRCLELCAMNSKTFPLNSSFAALAFLLIPNMPVFANIWHTYACEPNKKAEGAIQTQPACTTLPSLPPPSLLTTGNVRHAPTPTRGQVLYHMRYSLPEAPSSPCRACGRCCHACGAPAAVA
jgi:hypothetical protein